MDNKVFYPDKDKLISLEIPTEWTRNFLPCRSSDNELKNKLTLCSDSNTVGLLFYHGLGKGKVNQWLLPVNLL